MMRLFRLWQIAEQKISRVILEPVLGCECANQLSALVTREDLDCLTTDEESGLCVCVFGWLSTVGKW